MKNKYCIVTDWLDLYGGAERVVKVISKTYPIDTVYTLTDQRKADSKDLFFEGNPIIQTTPLKLLKDKFRLAFPLHPYFLRFLKISKNIDIIFSSSFNVAKGITKTNKKQIHICYFQTRNFKYIEDCSSLDNYFGSLKYFMLPFIKYLKKWDIRSAQNPDLFIANSKYTQQIIKEKYGRSSKVIYPPVDLKNFTFDAKKSDYYIAIGRFAPMKKFDLLIDAFNDIPDKHLILVGDGQLMSKFRKKANKNITFTGYLPSNEVNDLLKKAKACVCVGIEDFGIAAVEAQSCGTPVVAYAVGGTSETIKNNETGVLFYSQTKEAIIDSIKKVDSISFDYQKIHTNSQKYSIEKFKSEFKRTVDNYILMYRSNLEANNNDA